LRFDRISAADGLSFSISTSILQDRRGFMWFGTRYGLNKYDGFNFTFYVLESREDLLFSNYVLGLYQDRAGNLWGGTLSDLVRMEPGGEFVHYQHDAGNPQSLGPGQIRAIAEDSTGALWVATNQGLNRYEPSTETFTRFLQDQWSWRSMRTATGWQRYSAGRDLAGDKQWIVVLQFRLTGAAGS